MGTRSTLIFEIWPYPGRDTPPALTLHLYKHDDGDPGALQHHILHAWKEGRRALAADTNHYAHHPQISLCQAMVGIMLANAQAEFRLADHVASDCEYVYRFRQATASWTDAELSIIRSHDRKTMFEGGFQEFAKQWFEET